MVFLSVRHRSITEFLLWGRSTMVFLSVRQKSVFLSVRQRSITVSVCVTEEYHGIPFCVTEEYHGVCVVWQ